MSIRMKITTKDIYVGCFFLTLIQLSRSLRCYVCFEALDPTLCKYTETCSSDALCNQNVLQTLIGRKRQVKTITNTIKCCNTDLCNSVQQSTTQTQSTTQPTTVRLTTEAQVTVSQATVPQTTKAHTTVPQTSKAQTTVPQTTNVQASLPQSILSTLETTQTTECVDDESCGRLLHVPCDNPELAFNICPKTCNKCSELMTCVDQNADCEILIKHFSICITDVPFAEQKCKHSCKFCGHTGRETTVTSTDHMTPSRQTSIEQSVTSEYPEAMSSEAVTYAPDVYTSAMTYTMSSTTYSTSCGDPDFCLVLLQNGYELCSNDNTLKLCPNLCNGCTNTTSEGVYNVTTSGPPYTADTGTTDSVQVTNVESSTQFVNIIETTNNPISESTFYTKDLDEITTGTSTQIESTNIPFSENTSHGTSTKATPTSCGDPEYCLLILGNGYDLCSNIDTYALCPKLCDGCSTTEDAYKVTTSGAADYTTTTSVETVTKDSGHILTTATSTQVANTIQTTSISSPSHGTSTTAIPTSCGDPEYCLVILQNGYDLCSKSDTYSICPNMCDGCKHSTTKASTLISPTTTTQSTICTDPEFCIPILNNDFNLCNTEKTAILCPRACGKCTDNTGPGSKPVEGIIIG